MQRSPREPLTVKLERQLTQEMKGPNAQFRSVLENNFLFRTFIKFLAVFGVCLVIADGILTPAQSVLGAIQGLKVKVPDIETNTIVGISCAILIVLFLIQPLGITKLGTTFAPIVVMWLLFNMVFGIYVSGDYNYTYTFVRSRD
jgi:KUP system potassium uptake protein